jgi:hypothetical protein
MRSNDNRDIQVMKDFVQKNSKEKKRKCSLDEDEQYVVSDENEEADGAKKEQKKRGRPSK